MRLTAKVFLFYCTIISLFLALSGLLTSRDNFHLATQAIFLPVALYFLIASFRAIKSGSLDLTFEDKKVHLAIAFVILAALIVLAVFSVRTG